MKDEIIEMMGKKFSMRKILGENGWNIYINSKSEKVKAITKIIVTNDLRKMEEGFYRLQKISEGGK